jgi:hypothetical protein
VRTWREVGFLTARVRFFFGRSSRDLRGLSEGLARVRREGSGGGALGAAPSPALRFGIAAVLGGWFVQVFVCVIVRSRWLSARKCKFVKKLRVCRKNLGCVWEIVDARWSLGLVSKNFGRDGH